LPWCPIFEKGEMVERGPVDFREITPVRKVDNCPVRKGLVRDDPLVLPCMGDAARLDAVQVEEEVFGLAVFQVEPETVGGVTN
jgi:hypothetical protein